MAGLRGGSRVRSGPGHECWLHFFIIQLERWRGLLLCRVWEKGPCTPKCAGGTLGAGLVRGPCSTSSAVVGERIWSKPRSHQQPDPATPGLRCSRGWELSSPSGTETATLLKAVLGHLASAGPFCSSRCLLFFPLPVQPLTPWWRSSHPGLPRDQLFPMLSATQDSQGCT